MTDVVDPAVTVSRARPEPVGVSEFLPMPARERLVRAAREARSLPEGSFTRRRLVEDARVAVKTRWPRYFKD